ncbi:sodium/potassium/calcium exchanger 3 isoform X1 [Drosophila suzukii]|uniref:Sodium/potassium/calcium exchanger 5 n=1 Tax=Drosophila suzukii TaxID=28584 RepID=A0AB40AD24_DROSZ|nr:sodium/potassium/calcium exchanger 4 isoform X1 [Drosophila suzukii]XP_036675885.1 sodium/potassium/calcium exchanger 4 isoform X1 [Drosophila suzukii]XP_036675886.1 sodium/potassium/calcium exchanger 4 isoform X1 [Drosophila suzukii]XP_036675887.1 sodium/potassium/calcium exchanger 4 isoform X1 [Drosophila suzukii]
MEDYWGLSSTTDINCTQPAIDDFPRDLFSEAQRQSGAVVLHVIASLYLFVALAVVCDEYFVPAVEKICAALNMSNDVAGATFMAAATSAPELFVNVIGTFITEGDIGVGTIVGSAVFNILAVAACCGIGAGMTIPLDWWPLTRDSIAYGVTVAILICVMHDERVEWYEALILVSLYAVYLAVMYFDKTFQKCAKGGVKQARSRSRSSNCSIHTKNSNEKEPELVENRICQNMANIQLNGGLNNDQAKATGATSGGTNTISFTTSTMTTTMGTTTQASGEGGAPGDVPSGPGVIAQMATLDGGEAESQQAVTAAGEDREEEGYSLLTYPKEKSCFAQFTWLIIWPIHLLFRIAIPDCKKAKNNKIFPLTFIMCIVWIGSLSYVVAWMITIIGDTLKIPDSVMGITFLAAGTSVPEAVSSVIVAKRGHGSMGICNSIGSNTFDILLCLGVPWLIKAVFFPIQPGQNYVAINSAGLEYSAITLLSTLFLLYLTFSTNKFKLDKKVGTACLVMYLVFMVFASLIELNVFFRVNLPTCGRS